MSWNRLGHVTHVKEWYDLKQGVACLMACFVYMCIGVVGGMSKIGLCHVKDRPVSCQRVACVMSKIGLCHVKEWPVSRQRSACDMSKSGLCHIKE